MAEISGNDKQFTVMWNEAVSEFRKETGVDLTSANVPKPKNIDDLIHSVVAQHAKFSSFNEDRARLRQVLKYALAPVELLGNLAAGSASMAFPPTQLIFGGIQYLISTAENVGAAYNGIATLLDELHDFTVRFKIYGRQVISNELHAILVKVLVTLLKVVGLSAKRVRSLARFSMYVRFLKLILRLQQAGHNFVARVISHY